MAYEIEPQREPFRDAELDVAAERFYEGLTVLADIPGVAANFGQCLTRLASEPDFERVFSGMVVFLRTYHQFGIEEAQRAVGDVSGIPVTLAADGMGTFSGRVVALTGASDEEYGKFTAVACGELDNSGEQFMTVDLRLSDPGVAIIRETQR
jgi:hypothetical protein